MELKIAFLIKFGIRKLQVSMIGNIRNEQVGKENLFDVYQENLIDLSIKDKIYLWKIIEPMKDSLFTQKKSVLDKLSNQQNKEAISDEVEKFLSNLKKPGENK